MRFGPEIIASIDVDLTRASGTNSAQRAITALLKIVELEPANPIEHVRLFPNFSNRLLANIPRDNGRPNAGKCVAVRADGKMGCGT